MSERVLTVAELSRATLARQLLLVRVRLDPVSAIERPVGPQAQEAASPYLPYGPALKGLRPARSTLPSATGSSARAP
jgi:hypothetical protein